MVLLCHFRLHTVDDYNDDDDDGGGDDAHHIARSFPSLCKICLGVGL